MVLEEKIPKENDFFFERRSETDLEEELLMPEEHSSITIQETENSDSDLIRL